MTPEQLQTWLGDAARRPLIVGVLNVTPDSFSDGGLHLRREEAIAHARQLIADGADWIDIGGESTRPGSLPVPEQEQIDRVIPVIEALQDEPVILSIDTTQSAVARAALAAGAGIINDISAGTDDPEMPAAMAEARGVVLMHMLGRPRTMQADPRYADVVAEVESYLLARAAAIGEAGVGRQRILLDPGIGFGKTARHNLLLLKALPRLASHGFPILLGTSRKRFIGTITGEPEPARRVFGTAATVAWGVANGAAAVRVHDVREMRQVVEMVQAIRFPPAEERL